MLTPRIYTLPFVRTLHRTMIQSRTYGPQITVRRLTTKCRKKKPIFAQISTQVVQIAPHDLRLPARAWKVSAQYIVFHIFSIKYTIIVNLMND